MRRSNSYRSSPALGKSSSAAKRTRHDAAVVAAPSYRARELVALSCVLNDRSTRLHAFAPLDSLCHLLKAYVRHSCFRAGVVNTTSLPRTRATFGWLGTPARDRLRAPTAVQIDAHGRILVGDAAGVHFFFFNAADSQYQFSHSCATDSAPVALSTLPSGDHVIGAFETQNHVRILRCDDGACVCAFGFASANSPVCYPTGLACTSDERVIVADARVQVFRLDGSLVGPFGAPAVQMRFYPTTCAVDGDDNVLLYDGNDVRVFEHSGTFMRQFHVATADLASPAGVCSDSAGNIIVSEPSRHRVSVFRADGTRLCTFGSHGSDIGLFDRPSGVVVERSSGSIVVADTSNCRVQVWK